MSFFSFNPRLNIRRTYLVAKRDFVGYVKTWGFWLTALSPLFGMVLAALAPLLMMKSEPTRYVSILDKTGYHAAAIMRFQQDSNREIMTGLLRASTKYAMLEDQRDAFYTVLDEQGPEAAKSYLREINPRLIKSMKLPQSKLKFVDLPAQNLNDLKPFLLGEKTILVDGKAQRLAGVLRIYEKDGVLTPEYWTTKLSYISFPALVDGYFANLASDKYLKPAGLSYKQLRDVRKNAIEVETFSPEKIGDGGDIAKVSMVDRIPFFTAAALSGLLWFAVFTGAYMLLMSMVEEKINKVLEMLLATTRFSEIFVGKLIGIAALTLASFLPWIIMGAIGFFITVQVADPEIVAGLSQAVSPKMLFFLPVFFLLGYVFYGSMFIALGAMAESMQDASTLMTPMVLLLTACIMVVPIGFVFPDSSILTAAQWFPFSAPFAAIIRLPNNPPLWETIGSALVLVAASTLVVRLSARMFKHGVLTGGGGMAGVKAWFARVIFRKS
ncbi:MAG: ABC transporter permease [Robiginitomaculum sp.]